MYPSFKDIQNAGKSEELFRVNTCIRSAFPIIMKVFISGMLVIFLNILFEGYLRLSSIAEELPDISLRWLALVPAYYALTIVRHHYDTIYIFGSDGVRQLKGRLSLSKKVPYVKYRDILALRVHMDPWGRVFNYGDIDLDTAANDGVEIVIKNIARPKELGRLLEELRKRRD